MKGVNFVHFLIGWYQYLSQIITAHVLYFFVVKCFMTSLAHKPELYTVPIYYFWKVRSAGFWGPLLATTCHLIYIPLPVCTIISLISKVLEEYSLVKVSSQLADFTMK